MVQRCLVTIKPITKEGVIISWAVFAGKINGVHQRKRFRVCDYASEAEAKAAGKYWAKQVMGEKLTDKRLGIKLSPSQKIEAARAFETRDSASCSEPLDAIVRSYLSTGPRLDSWTVKEATEALLKDRAGKRRSAKSLEGYRIHFNILVHDFGNLKLDSLSGDDFNDWISSNNWSVGYVRYWYQIVRMLYSFAIQKKRASIKPWLEMYRPDLDDDPPPVYNVREAKTLLKYATPYVARGLVLGLFCGLRPENEASSITYDQIDLERRKITVVGRKAKSRRHRRVTIPENLVPWIEKLDWTEPYNYERWRNTLAALRKELDIRSGHDILRHSFGSHHLALYEDEAKTRFELGHADPNILFEHYRALVHKEDAREYFGITPETTFAANGQTPNLHR